MHRVVGAASGVRGAGPTAPSRGRSATLGAHFLCDQQEPGPVGPQPTAPHRGRRPGHGSHRSMRTSTARSWRASSRPGEACLRGRGRHRHVVFGQEPSRQARGSVRSNGDRLLPLDESTSACEGHPDHIWTVSLTRENTGDWLINDYGLLPTPAAPWRSRPAGSGWCPRRSGCSVPTVQLVASSVLTWFYSGSSGPESTWFRRVVGIK